VRVVTYNVQSLRASPSGVADVLRAAEPDIVCVQEAPRFLLASWRMRRLSAACGLVAVGRGRLAGDTAVLVAPSVSVRRFRRLRLSRTSGLHRRGALVVRVAVEGHEVTIASVHLGLDAVERVRHAQELVTALAAYKRPFVVAADVNERPGGDAWRVMSTAIGPAANTRFATFPARDPQHVIDTVFVGGPLRVIATGVVRSTASDHRAVIVDVQA
jgi:endonuclease/exonuclease/phosphatase family metal-dependent hydrolase